MVIVVICNGDLRTWVDIEENKIQSVFLFFASQPNCWPNTQEHKMHKYDTDIFVYEHITIIDTFFVLIQDKSLYMIT